MWKIGLVLERFTPYGGAEQYALEFAKQLFQRGVEVHLIGFSFPSSLPKGIVSHLARRGKTRFTDHWHLFHSVQNVRFHCRLDLVWTMARIPHQEIAQLHGGLHRLSRRQNLLAHPHSLGKRLFQLLSPRQWSLLFWENQVYKSQKTLRFLALSHWSLEHLKRAYPHLSSKWQVLYPAVDLQRFSPDEREKWQKQGENPVQKGIPFLFVAHSPYLKGLPKALEVLFLLRQHIDAKLLVLGDFSKKPFLKWLKKKNLVEHVFFLGSVKKPEVYYSFAKALLHPTYYDPCSLACLEALAMGVPVVTTRQNGVAELLPSSWVVESPENTFQMVETLLKLLSSSRTWEAASEKARQIVTPLGWESHMEQVMKILEEVVE